jgi:predicted GNAT family acetyltransferase
MGERPGPITIHDNAALHRFEAIVEGQAAFLSYRLDGKTLHLVHTEVPATLAGRGLGGELARAALNAARARGLRVVPTCPFVRTYIERHPEFAGLVAA